MTLPGHFSGIYFPSAISHAVADRQFRRKVTGEPTLYWWKLQAPDGFILIVGGTEAQRLDILRDIKEQGHQVLNHHLATDVI